MQGNVKLNMHRIREAASNQGLSLETLCTEKLNINPLTLRNRVEKGFTEADAVFLALVLDVELKKLKEFL